MQLKKKVDWIKWIRDESHIDFCTQCVIMTIGGMGRGTGGGGITNDFLKFRKRLHTSLIIDEKSSSNIFKIMLKIAKSISY